MKRKRLCQRAECLFAVEAAINHDMDSTHGTTAIMIIRGLVREMNMDKIRDKLLTIEGVFNIRELGGYQNIQGIEIKRQRFVRSASLCEITSKGVDVLVNMGVDCIIDLRSLSEARNMPDRIAAHEAFKHYHIPMLDNIRSNISAQIKLSFHQSLAEMYQHILDDSQESIKAVFTILADKQHRSILFHCTGGKDRTGVIAMLLLGLARVDEETIIEDYAWSQHLIDLEPFKAIPFEIPPYLLESNPAVMRETLNYIKDKYKGIGNYLAQIGISEEQKQSILHKLFV